MSQAGFPQRWPGFYPTNFNTDKLWRVSITGGGENFGEYFVPEGPTIYLLPVGFFYQQIREGSVESFTPWIPILQQEVLIPAVEGKSGADVQIRGFFLPGVTGTIANIA